MKYLLRGKGERVLLSGNEAVARGAIEAGIKFITGYPGTPASDIVDVLARVAKDLNLYVEWSVNEKVAFEAAFAAALAKVKSMFVCKHLGLNWIMDPWIVASETGVNAPFIIVTGDDVHPYASQTAQDTRYFAITAKSPMLEPATIQEAKDIISYASKVSSELYLPVVVRVTLRICHSKGVTILNDIKLDNTKPEFPRNPDRYVMIASYVRRRLPELKRKYYIKAQQLAEQSSYNKVLIKDDAKLGIIASGITFTYAKEALEILRLENRISILKLAWHSPLPKRLIADFLAQHDEILVLEEIDPVIEEQVKAIAFEHDLKPRVYGRLTGHIPMEGEIRTETVINALSAILKLNRRLQYDDPEELKKVVVRRIPYLCPGCPHRASYYVLKYVLNKLGKKYVITGDRGCYNQGVHPPLRAIDTCICMGASIAMAHGFSKALEDYITVAVIGDSTFFHAGLPALVNATYNNSKPLIVVLDNQWTAMTGLQPNPATGLTATLEPTLKFYPEAASEALGVDYVKVVDPYNISEAIKIVHEAIKYIEEKGKPAVIVFRHPCRITELRELKKKGFKPNTYVVDESLCKGCKYCITVFGCPAIEFNSLTKKASINPIKCNGCGVCSQICPFGAIKTKS